MAGRGRQGRARKRTRDPEGSKERILKAATALFTRCGLNGASLDDISREAGVNRGLIYHYFRTKESLFDQVLARPLARFVQSQMELFARADLDATILREATEGLFRFLATHPDLVRLLGWTLAMRRVAGDFGQLEFTRALYASVCRRIEDAKREGKIRADVDARQLLITVVDLCVSWHLSREEWERRFDWDGRDRDALDAERMEAIVDFVAAAIRPSGEVRPA